MASGACNVRNPHEQAPIQREETSIDDAFSLMFLFAGRLEK